MCIHYSCTLVHLFYFGAEQFNILQGNSKNGGSMNKTYHFKARLWNSTKFDKDIADSWIVLCVKFMDNWGEGF